MTQDLCADMTTAHINLSLSEVEKKPVLQIEKGKPCFATHALNLLFTSDDFILLEKKRSFHDYMNTKKESKTKKVLSYQKSDLMTLLSTQTQSNPHSPETDSSYVVNILKFIETLSIVCDDTVPKIPLLKRDHIPNNVFIQNLQIIQMDPEFQLSYKTILTVEILKLEYQFLGLDFSKNDDVIFTNPASSLFYSSTNYLLERVNSLGYSFSSSVSTAFLESVLQVSEKAHQVAEYIKLCKIMKVKYKKNLPYGIIRLVEEIFTMIYHSELSYSENLVVIRRELQLVKALDSNVVLEIEFIILNQMCAYKTQITQEIRDEQVNNKNPSPILLVSILKEETFIGHSIEQFNDLKKLSGDDDDLDINLESNSLPKSYLSNIPNFFNQEDEEVTRKNKTVKELDRLFFDFHCDSFDNFSKHCFSYEFSYEKSNFTLAQNMDNILVVVTNATPIPEFAVKKLKGTLMNIVTGLFSSLLDDATTEEYVNNDDDNDAKSSEKPKQSPTVKQVKINECKKYCSLSRCYNCGCNERIDFRNSSLFKNMKFPNSHLKMNTHPMGFIENENHCIQEANSLQHCANPSFAQDYLQEVQKFACVYQKFGAENLKHSSIIQADDDDDNYVIGTSLDQIVIDQLVAICRLTRINECYETRGTVSNVDVLNQLKFKNMVTKNQNWSIRNNHLNLLMKIYRKLNPLSFQSTNNQIRSRDMFKLMLNVDMILRKKIASGAKWFVHISLHYNTNIYGYPFDLSFCVDDIADTGRFIPCKMVIFDRNLIYQRSKEKYDIRMKLSEMKSIQNCRQKLKNLTIHIHKENHDADYDHDIVCKCCVGKRNRPRTR